jgi:hypothetical protein
MAGGRPSDFTPELGQLILERIAEGESLRKVCRADDLPSRETVRRWLRDDPEFRAQYALAREEQADAKFEEAWEIADAATSETVQVARLKVDTIKWQASKLAPKVYGDKLAIGGDDALGPLTVVINKPA